MRIGNWLHRFTQILKALNTSLQYITAVSTTAWCSVTAYVSLVPCLLHLHLSVRSSNLKALFWTVCQVPQVAIRNVLHRLTQIPNALNITLQFITTVSTTAWCFSFDPLSTPTTASSDHPSAHRVMAVHASWRSPSMRSPLSSWQSLKRYHLPTPLIMHAQRKQWCAITTMFSVSKGVKLWGLPLSWMLIWRALWHSTTWQWTRVIGRIFTFDTIKTVGLVRTAYTRDVLPVLIAEQEIISPCLKRQNVVNVAKEHLAERLALQVPKHAGHARPVHTFLQRIFELSRVSAESVHWCGYDCRCGNPQKVMGTYTIHSDCKTSLLVYPITSVSNCRSSSQLLSQLSSQILLSTLPSVYHHSM